MRLSLFGDGLLERARSTSFALLGLATAVCLGIVALAANQDWPSIAESPIPALPSPVGDEDRKVAQDRDAGGDRPSGEALSAVRGAGSDTAEGDAGGAADPTAVRAEPRGQSVSTSAPAGDGVDGNGGQARPAPRPSPTPVSRPVSQPSPQPAPAPEEPVAPPPPAPPSSPPAPEPPPPTTASGPPGNGNAYGWENGKAKGHYR